MEFVIPVILVVAVVVYFAVVRPKNRNPNQGGGSGKNPDHNTDQH